MPFSALLRPLSSVQSAVRALLILLFGQFQKGNSANFASWVFSDLRVNAFSEVRLTEDEPELLASASPLHDHQ
jgi:hypothetical protein